ncbi:MAG: HAMP domain-containing sensor histidine kinase [Ruminococcus sp.]|nr:HAMP domain-containing sensor histidine kinase [Ruminococcus sp.]
MKKSIRNQIIVTFLGFVVVSLTIVFILNSILLEPVYLDHKKDILETAYTEMISKYDSTDVEKLSKFCSTNNLSVVIYNINGGTLLQPDYSNLRNEDADRLRARLFGYLVGLESVGNQVIEKNDNYTLLYNRDNVVQMEFMEMWGQTSSGIAFIVRCPIESVQESVKLSNRFYLLVNVGVALLGIAFIRFMAKKITKPITELTEISQQMANLDFEAHYTSGGEDEIGILGDNINKLSHTLEKTIAELKTANNELQKDIEKKEAIDEMRKEFLANVSHELKTPIALIQGYAEGLQDNINDDAESREFYCEVIIDEAMKMNEMVKKLLSLNQLEFGNDQVHMERFDLTDLISGVVQASSILAQQSEAEIIFRQHEPIYVWGDEFKIEEVLTNYITNAIHHVKYEKKIDIRCVAEHGTVKVIVFNTGDIIPEEDLDKIWEKFYKVDKARTREYGGSGIGLSIVKAIMESMNQQCGVKNFNNGVAFWFTLEEASGAVVNETLL